MRCFARFSHHFLQNAPKRPTSIMSLLLHSHSESREFRIKRVFVFPPSLLPYASCDIYY